MSEHGYMHPERGYWQAVGEPLDPLPDGVISVPLRPSPNHEWQDDEWVFVEPTPPPATDTVLTPPQWRYGLRRFALLSHIEAFVAALEPDDAVAAYQFEARALHAGSFAFADVLTLLATYEDALPPELDLTVEQVSTMWATVLAEMPASPG